MRKTGFTAIIMLLTFLSMTLFAQDKFLYVGVKKCKTCHKMKKYGNQYEVWQKAAHSNALKSLSNKESLEYAKKNGIEDPAKDPKCLKCHSTMATVDKKLIDPKGKLTIEEGVSCESCHGPGSVYKSNKIMKDHKACLENGLIEPTEAVCKECHNKDNPFHKGFDFKEALKKVQHPLPEKK